MGLLSLLQIMVLKDKDKNKDSSNVCLSLRLMLQNRAKFLTMNLYSLWKLAEMFYIVLWSFEIAHDASSRLKFY